MSHIMDFGDEGHVDHEDTESEGGIRLEDEVATRTSARHENSAPSSSNDHPNEFIFHETDLKVPSTVDRTSAGTPLSTGSMEITVDCEYDLEAYLEEFSRLTRKGKFDAARDLYNSCPVDLRDHPEFVLDYVDTLLRQGDFKSLMKFATEKETFLEKQLSDCGLIPAHYPRSVFEIGKLRTIGYRNVGYLERGNLEDIKAGEVRSELVSNFETLDSLHVQLLCNIIQLDSEVEKNTQAREVPYKKSENPIRKSLDWHSLYRHLLSTNRIWDMRDLFHALCSKYGVGDTINLLFKNQKEVIPPKKAPKSEDSEFSGWFHFIFDWSHRSHGDESTDLALLDILVTISLQLLSHGGQNKDPVRKLIKQAISHANQFAISLSLSNPQNVQASPYLRWVLATQILRREFPMNLHETPNMEYLKKASGILVWTCNLPIYVNLAPLYPCKVIWKPQPRRTPENLLNLGLDAARKNGDYSLAVQYLEEIFYTSNSPLQVLNELSHLQRDIQGDATGYLRTCLTKYLCATNISIAKALYNELREYDKQNRPSNPNPRFIDPITKYCQRVIQTALSVRLHRKTDTRDYLFKQQDIHQDLPYDFKRSLAELGKTDGTHNVFPDEAVPKMLEAPCKGPIYRDGNFVICDSSGYFTKGFTATSKEGTSKEGVVD